MKKISLSLNFVLVALITCLLYSNCSNNSIAKTCNPCKDYTGTTFNYLDAAMLHEMSANYDSTPIIFNSPRPGYPVIVNRGTSNNSIIRNGNSVQDARSIWFSLDSLKKFIWQIENTVCSNKCSNVKNLGIRLYYARYPMTSTYSQLVGLDPAYKKLHTIFMVPTYEAVNTSNKIYNQDFDPRFFDPIKCSYNSIRESRIGTQLLVFSPDQTARNHGTLCPTECEGTEF